MVFFGQDRAVAHSRIPVTLSLSDRIQTWIDGSPAGASAFNFASDQGVGQEWYQGCDSGFGNWYAEAWSFCDYSAPSVLYNILSKIDA
jgi:hypothetical protein